jgi:hypothetical protein
MWMCGWGVGHVWGGVVGEGRVEGVDVVGEVEACFAAGFWDCGVAVRVLGGVGGREGGSVRWRRGPVASKGSRVEVGVGFEGAGDVRSGERGVQVTVGSFEGAVDMAAARHLAMKRSMAGCGVVQSVSVSFCSTLCLAPRQSRPCSPHVACVEASKRKRT